MKKMFDELREEINATIGVELFGEEYTGIKRVNRIINEAEAKWEADCCEWKHKRYHANCLCKCNDNHIFLDYDLVSSFRVCPYCGKPINISEVE